MHWPILAGAADHPNHRDVLDTSGLTELIGELVRHVGVTEAARTLVVDIVWCGIDGPTLLP